jgi:predicted metal-dependent hydrolase
MTEQQFKRWMNAKTRQYIWLILHKDPNRVRVAFLQKFNGSFKSSHGASNKANQIIYYRTDYVINGWDCDLKALENLIIHEVCHLKYYDHDNKFFIEYKKWSGDDFIGRWCASLVDDGTYVSHVIGLPKLTGVV